MPALRLLPLAAKIFKCVFLESTFYHPSIYSSNRNLGPKVAVVWYLKPSNIALYNTWTEVSRSLESLSSPIQDANTQKSLVLSDICILTKLGFLIVFHYPVSTWWSIHESIIEICTKFNVFSQAPYHKFWVEQCLLQQLEQQRNNVSACIAMRLKYWVWITLEPPI